MEKNKLIAIVMAVNMLAMCSIIFTDEAEAAPIDGIKDQSLYAMAEEKTNPSVNLFGFGESSVAINEGLAVKTDRLSILTSIDQLAMLSNNDILLLNEELSDNDEQVLKSSILPLLDEGTPIIVTGKPMKFLKEMMGESESTFSSVVSAYMRDPQTGTYYTYAYIVPPDTPQNGALKSGVQLAVTWSEDLLAYKQASSLAESSDATTTSNDAEWRTTHQRTYTFELWPHGRIAITTWVNQHSADGDPYANYFVVKKSMKVTPGNAFKNAKPEIKYDGKSYEKWKQDDLMQYGDLDASYPGISLIYDSNGKMYDPQSQTGSTQGVWNLGIGIGIRSIGISIGWTQAIEKDFRVQFIGTTTGGEDYVGWQYWVDTDSYGSGELDYTIGYNVKSELTPDNPTGEYADDGDSWWTHWIRWHKNNLIGSSHYTHTINLGGTYPYAI